MTDFTGIKTVDLPMAALAAAYRHFREMGERGCEGVALWVGRGDGDHFTITETVIPGQKGIRSDSGLAYVVEQAELHRLNVWLYENQLRLIAQIHSHPTEAYHSSTDDAFPIMTTDGGFSVVVPDFGMGRPDLGSCAVYRLIGHSWRELKPSQVAASFRIT